MSSVVCCLNGDARLVIHCGTSVDTEQLCYPEDSKFPFIVLKKEMEDQEPWYMWILRD